jgi:hypothetical protein
MDVENRVMRARLPQLRFQKEHYWTDEFDIGYLSE